MKQKKIAATAIAAALAMLGCGNDVSPTGASPEPAPLSTAQIGLSTGGSAASTDDDSFRAVVMAWFQECPTGAPTPCLTLILKGYPVLVFDSTSSKTTRPGG